MGASGCLLPGRPLSAPGTGDSGRRAGMSGGIGRSGRGRIHPRRRGTRLPRTPSAARSTTPRGGRSDASGDGRASPTDLPVWSGAPGSLSAGRAGRGRIGDRVGRRPDDVAGASYVRRVGRRGAEDELGAGSQVLTIPRAPLFHGGLVAELHAPP